MNNKNIERLLRFDSIRIFKLFEIFYYTILSFIITNIFTIIINDDNIFQYIFKTYDNNETSNLGLIKDIFIDLMVLVVFIYYLKKILNCFPFIFAPLNNKYKPSMKGEVYVGIGLGSSLVLYNSLYDSIKSKLKILNERLYKIY
tara:strand:- start:17 stop:448 length:432 start_codon:yes stop_codon:yes gene_type:complete